MAAFDIQEASKTLPTTSAGAGLQVNTFGALWRGNHSAVIGHLNAQAHKGHLSANYVTLQVYTFGAPRVGNHAFCARVWREAAPAVERHQRPGTLSEASVFSSVL